MRNYLDAIILKYEYYTFSVLWFKNDLLDQGEVNVTKENTQALKTFASSFTH